MIDEIRKNNKNLKIYSINDKEFSEYGRVLKKDFSSLISTAEALPIKNDGVMYSPSVDMLEDDKVFEKIENEYFGQMPTQVGICLGQNSLLNALEWHTASEINVAVTPIILMLGRRQDIKDNKYNSENVKMFFLDKGEAVEIYATTLHYTPCQVKSSGFSCIVALPKGTNTMLVNASNNPLLRAKNKWLIAHENNEKQIANGAVAGIFGENYKINY